MTGRSSNKHIKLKFLARRTLRGLKKSLFAVVDITGKAVFGLFTRTGPATARQLAGIENILVVRLDRIGDLILSTPAIKALCEAYPGAKIRVLATPYTECLLYRNPSVDEVITLKKGLTGLLRCARQLMGVKADLSVVLHPTFTGNMLAFLSKARVRVGYSFPGGFFLTQAVEDTRSVRIRHEVESAMELAQAAGAANTGLDLLLEVQPGAAKEADALLKQNGFLSSDRFVTIHPGGRYPHMRWKKEGFAAVADRLVQAVGVKTVLIGTKKEEPLCREISSLMKTGAFVAAARTDLSQLVALISKSSLFIGNSSGPMHIAAALGVPVVAVFGNVHPLDSHQEWGPWAKKKIIVSGNPGCAACRPDECQHLDCMEGITPDMVYEAARKLL